MTKEIKITWKKDDLVGECELTKYRTQWIATSEYGSIRCFRYYKPFGMKLDSVVWNKILSNKMEQDKITFERNNKVVTVEKITFTKTETEMYVSLANKILWLLKNDCELNNPYFKGVNFAFEKFRDILKEKYNMKHKTVDFLNMIGASRKQHNLEVK